MVKSHYCLIQSKWGRSVPHLGVACGAVGAASVGGAAGAGACAAACRAAAAWGLGAAEGGPDAPS